jgi:fatty-acyl-CoA synthase
MSERGLISGLPSTTNDLWQLNLWKVIKHASRVHGKTEVVSYRENQGGKTHRMNYSEVYKRVCSMSNALESLGVKPGDIIAVLGWNDHRYYESYFSIPGIGAVLLELNNRLHVNELTYILKHSKAKALFFDESLVETAEELAKNYRFDFTVIMGDKGLGKINTSLEKVYDYEKLVSENKGERDWKEIDEKSAATACYTSGTTGLPKGVLFSHRFHCLEAITYVHVARMDVDDVYMQTVPMFHANGWLLHLSSTMIGTKIVLPGKYSAKSLVEIMLREGVTVTAGVPTIFNEVVKVLDGMEERPRLNVKAVIAGSTPSISLIKKMMDYGITPIHVYGYTEGNFVTYNHMKRELKALNEEEKLKYLQKQGLPVWLVEFKVVNPESKEELPWDGKSVGEVWVRGVTAKEYYKDERTREYFTGDWFRPGDTGSIDAFGYFSFFDRSKDLIKSGGEWISSVDLENYLFSHPFVSEATVIGIPHPKWEERPLAVVVVKPDFKGIPEEKLEEELKSHLLKRFAKWQIPDKIVFVNEIPKTSVGKIDKKVLKQKFKDFYH